ncbi:MAG: hypothetical protein ABW048_00785, partial [Sphingobium sp.]
SFCEVEDRAADIVRDIAARTGADKSGATVVRGEEMAMDNLCRIDADRSRVTVSDTSDVQLGWTREGCINGKTQLVRNGETWGRVLVPADEPSASIRTVDPATGTYRSENYALDAATADAARKARTGVEFAGCTTEPAKLEALTRLEANIRALLPPEPNERLVYHCTPGRPPVAP